MRIDSINIQNFKGIRELSFELDANLNVIIGDNGSGKTAVLEAITIAAGSFFIGINGASTRGIRASDLHLAEYQEYLYPSKIVAWGEIEGDKVSWSRERNSFRGSTTTKGSNDLRYHSWKLDQKVREGENVNLPVIAFFSTGRLFVESQIRQRKKRNIKNKNNEITSYVRVHEVKEIASRFRGYKQSLDAKSNFKVFSKWFELMEMSQIQKSYQDTKLFLVKNAIQNTLPNCKNVYFELNPDLNTGITVEFKDGRVMPFSYLSDGMRSFFALIADIAYRCVILNPHLEKEALLETQGIVLIDELDLHLHPSWQKIVIESLQKTFPKIQFIISTHSPFLIQETNAPQLIMLENCKVSKVTGANNRSIEDISEEIQGLKMPQWSKKRNYMFEVSKKYYEAVQRGDVSQELEDELNESMKPFAHDTAYHAILEQERILRKFKKEQS